MQIVEWWGDSQIMVVGGGVVKFWWENCELSCGEVGQYSQLVVRWGNSQIVVGWGQWSSSGGKTVTVKLW